jgi:hypothetical protein
LGVSQSVPQRRKRNQGDGKAHSLEKAGGDKP